ncbi:MAG TPA: FHA domain-containing protein [Blastocatellia bacterium]
MSNTYPHSVDLPSSGCAEILVRKPGQREVRIEISSRITIGRAFDNVVVLNDDGVSRYHAMIEPRADGFWLTDLGSRNGTRVNDELIATARKLRDGDTIAISGTSTISFCGESGTGPLSGTFAAGQKPSVSRGEGKSSAPAPAPPLSVWWIVAAIAIPVTVIGVGVLAFSGAFNRSATIPGPVHIVGVHSGDTISEPTFIRTDADNTSHIASVTYQLDDVDLARVKVPPYETKLDPAELATRVPNAEVSNHVLSLIVEDKDGTRSVQPDKVVVAFAPESATEAGGAGTGAVGGDTPSNSGEANAAAGIPTSNDVSYLAGSLARQISKKTVVFAPELVDAIRIRSRDYRFNFADDARRVNPREIASAFNDKGIDPIVGLVLAMSRTRFRASTGTEGIGLWQLPKPVLMEFAAGQDQSNRNDAQQDVAIASAYTKALFGLFDPEDFMYAIACYGMTTAQAGEVRAKLSQGFKDSDRHYFWAAAQAGLLPREGVDRVVSFFAAGIVGEYPEKFGMHSTPLSELYY